MPLDLLIFAKQGLRQKPENNENGKIRTAAKCILIRAKSHDWPAQTERLGILLCTKIQTVFSKTYENVSGLALHRRGSVQETKKFELCAIAQKKDSCNANL